MNHKQKELLEDVVNDLKQYYPKFAIRVLSEEGDTVRIKTTMPEDDDENWELGSRLADQLTRILVDYGYYFWVLPSH